MPEAKNKNIQGSAARKKAGAQKARTSPAKRPRRKKRKPKKVNIGVWTAVGIAASVILALAVMFISQGGGGGHETGAKVPPGDWRYGIDISHHNAGDIVWDSLYVLTDKQWKNNP